MILNQKIIETRLFPNANLQIEGYLEGLKIDMMEHNEAIIDRTNARPVFKVAFTERIITRN